LTEIFPFPFFPAATEASELKNYCHGILCFPEQMTGIQVFPLSYAKFYRTYLMRDNAPSTTIRLIDDEIMTAEAGINCTRTVACEAAGALVMGRTIFV
jgi:hypothetical protein